MNAIALLATLKPSPNFSNTEELLDIVLTHLKNFGINTEKIRLADLNINHGSHTDMKDDFGGVLKKIAESDIVIFATPIHWGQPSSIMQKIIERLNQIDDEYLESEKDTVLKHKVAGMVITGHEDGAQHVIGSLANALMWYGFVIPPESATYWVGESGAKFSDDVEDRRKNKYTQRTAKEMAKNLYNYAKLISENKDKLK